MQRPTTTDKMIGHIIEPVQSQQPDSSASQHTSQQPKPHSAPPRYRLQQLIQSESGKRTFLATDERSQNQVVVKLLLYGTDPTEGSAAEPTFYHPSHLSDSTLQDTVMLPYLDSFEVETPLGPALALIKPCVSSTQTPNCLTHNLIVPPIQSDSSRRHNDYSNGLSHQSPDLSTSTQQSSRNTNEVTTAPQHSYGSFRVRPTPNKLEIRCLKSHIREGLTIRTHSKPFIETVELWIAIILGTFGFVGGAVISTGSIGFGVAVAAVLPILFRQLTIPRARQQQKAILRLTNESGGRTFVSLMTLTLPKQSRKGRSVSAPTESTLHFSRMSIKRIKIEPAFLFSFGVDPLAAAIVVTFHHYNTRTKNRLRIVGSYKEIRWLSHHLSKWGDARSTDSAD